MDQTRQQDGCVDDSIMEQMNTAEERASSELSYPDTTAEIAVTEAEEVILEARRKVPTGQIYILASIGALGAAILGGLVWGLFTLITNYELGIIAWGIGGLCGYGVLLITRRQRGTFLQIIAATASIFGILFGKYLTFIAAFRDLLGDDYKELFSFMNTLCDSKVFNIFMQEFKVMVQPYDLLWIGLALITAWKTLQATDGLISHAD